jgi:lysophospholipase L1-like esterase
MVGANVCILGDSLTFQSVDDNFGAGGGWNNGIYDGYGWYSRIARKYFQKFRYKGNEGARWFGKTSCIEDVKTIIAEGVVYDYIILEYGTNDITLGGIGDVTDIANENAETSIQAIRYCIESLQEAFPTTKIIVIMPCMRNNTAKPTQAIYYEKVGSVLREYGVRMCNMAWDSGIAFNMMYGDGIHLRVLRNINGTLNPSNDTEACARYSRCLEATMLMV